MAGVVDPEFSGLLATLYAGIAEERPWHRFLEALASWLDSSHATLIITAPGKRQPATFLTPGSSPDFEANYMQSLFADDPFQGLGDGVVTSYAEFMGLLPDDAYPEYRKVMAETGFDQVLGLDLHFGQTGMGAGRIDDGRYEARFRLTRHRSLPNFTSDDRARFQALAAHLKIAVRLYEKLEFAGAEHGVFHATTQGLGLALVILDRNHRIVSTNALADELLGQSEGLLRRGDALVLADPVNQRRVTGLLAGEGAGGLTRFRIDRAQCGDLVATARPLDVSTIHAGAGALALFLARPGADQRADPQTLRDFLGLTIAEARLTAVLAEGLSLVEAAKRLGIAHNTAKVQLRSVFAKTGVHRQAQLMALLGSLGGS